MSTFFVTDQPSRIREGKRPTTVYIGAQHAREWITPEMVRRLLDHILDGVLEGGEVAARIGKKDSGPHG